MSITQTTSKQLKILVFADLHHLRRDSFSKLSDIDYDCCALLGDISDKEIAAIKNIVKNKPIFGVLGDHDTFETLDYGNVINLDRGLITLNGVTITGIGGSLRHNDNPNPTLTQHESVKAARKCPKANILISHDTAFGIMRQKDKAHRGLKGITRYIKRKKPRLNICGHYHTNFHSSLKQCEIICVYQCALITYPNTEVKILF